MKFPEFVEVTNSLPQYNFLREGLGSASSIMSKSRGHLDPLAIEAYETLEKFQQNKN